MFQSSKYCHFTKGCARNTLRFIPQTYLLYSYQLACLLLSSFVNDAVRSWQYEKNEKCFIYLSFIKIPNLKTFLRISMEHILTTFTNDFSSIVLVQTSFIRRSAISSAARGHYSLMSRTSLELL